MAANLRTIIASSKVLLAPMAGVTDFPFRQIVRSFGVGLVCTEMIASRAILEALKNSKRRRKLHFFDSTREPGPVAIQLVGYDPDIMAEAAKFNEQLGASVIDINMGCPVKKVVNTEAGAALMKNEILAGKIIEAVVNAVTVPVTVKMRLGWDAQHINAPALAKIAESVGAQGVTIHGRTRSQFYEGKADWVAIKNVKESVGICVVGNGDVRSAEDAVKMLAESGADAVMVGRGAVGRPWVCSQIQNTMAVSGDGERISVQNGCDGEIVAAQNGCDGERISVQNESCSERNSAQNGCDDDGFLEEPINVREVVLRHVQLMIEEYGEEHGVLLARKHVSAYSKERTGAANFRNLVNSLKTSEEVLQAINCFW
jgi:tRNA-dihydrouridine synthase B